MPLDAQKRGALYTLFTPVVRLAHHFELPLKDLRELLDIAYFEEQHRNGRTFREIAEIFDVSTRKITQLSHGLKSLLLVNESEQRYGLPRKLELMIWASPMSDRRLSQVLVLEHTPDDIKAALTVLLERGAIVWDKQAAVYRPVPLHQRRDDGSPSDDLLARLDALRDFIDGVTDLVQARFFGKAATADAASEAPATESDAAPDAFVRTHNFHLLPEDLKYLKNLHDMFRLVRDQLEARAQSHTEREGTDRRTALSFVMMWAPRARRPG